jgi:hypothetical protein
LEDEDEYYEDCGNDALDNHDENYGDDEIVDHDNEEIDENEDDFDDEDYNQVYIKNKSALLGELTVE